MMEDAALDKPSFGMPSSGIAVEELAAGLQAHNADRPR
jgi:hypothetical protein